MSYQAAKESYVAEIAEIKAAGLWKTERVIASDQKNDITLEGGATTTTRIADLTELGAQHISISLKIRPRP